MVFSLNKTGKKERKIKNVLAMSIFFAASYISLGLNTDSISWILGILFLISGMYGLVCIDDKLRYIF